MVFGFYARSGRTSVKSDIRNVEMTLTISANFHQPTHHVSLGAVGATVSLTLHFQPFQSEIISENYFKRFLPKKSENCRHKKA
jgi:hypothetical protein